MALITPLVYSNFSCCSWLWIEFLLCYECFRVWDIGATFYNISVILWRCFRGNWSIQRKHPTCCK